MPCGVHVAHRGEFLRRLRADPYNSRADYQPPAIRLGDCDGELGCFFYFFRTALLLSAANYALGHVAANPDYFILAPLHNLRRALANLSPGRALARVRDAFRPAPAIATDGFPPADDIYGDPFWRHWLPL